MGDGHRARLEHRGPAAARTVLGEWCSLPRKPWTINSGFRISLEFISYYIIRDFSRY